MDSRSLTLLEFPAVRGRLAEATSFPPSRRLAEALEPSADPVIVARSLEETDQARSLIEDRPGVGIGAARDIGPAVERAARGGRLEPLQFLELADTLDATSRLATVLADDRRPLLHELARDLHSLPALRSTLARSFDPVGELLDTASPRLGGLRAAVRVAYDRLRRRLDSLVGAELGNALQEPIVTLRNGRYVVPVKAEARCRVKGIVHDASGSGQTLFIEPLVAVELGNAWREAQVAEAEEIARILDELSAFVAANAAALRETLGALARFDLWAAKASLAADMDATRAETADRPEVVLLSARHPGLAGRVVPIDIRLGDGYTALVVTGPNTGGKTVTLRTLGLLSLMHQAGLHIPAAARSRLPIWQDVFADIGDEQSIAQSLSTFSGHLRSIIRIVAAAGPGTLVLLDELGAGTDPDGGSALAQALLDHFIRAGAIVAATTHYAELKAYAHTTPGARNAAVEFDLDTLVADVPADDRPARQQPGLRDRRSARPVRDDRRRRAVPADGITAHVRGDPGGDPRDRRRDQRGTRAGEDRRTPGHRCHARRRGRAPAGSPRTGRGRSRCTSRSRASRRRSPKRSRLGARVARAPDVDGAGPR